MARGEDPSLRKVLFAAWGTDLVIAGGLELLVLLLTTPLRDLKGAHAVNAVVGTVNLAPVCTCIHVVLLTLYGTVYVFLICFYTRTGPGTFLYYSTVPQPVAPH